jgi:RNA polymerase sigma-70 factor (ECF subfamily)
MSQADQSETKIIQAALQGDERARDLLAESLYPRLHTTACHFLGPADPEAQDAVQEALLKVFKNLESFKGKSSLYTWASHICVNVCFDRLNKRRKRLETQTEDLELAALSWSQEAHEHKQQNYEKEEQAKLLRKAIQAMPQPCRGLIEKHHLQGMSCAQLARQQKTPLGTLLAKLWRCREALRARVAQEGRLS